MMRFTSIVISRHDVVINLIASYWLDTWITLLFGEIQLLANVIPLIGIRDMWELGADPANAILRNITDNLQRCVNGTAQEAPQLPLIAEQLLLIFPAIWPKVFCWLLKGVNWWKYCYNNYTIAELTIISHRIVAPVSLPIVDLRKSLSLRVVDGCWITGHCKLYISIRFYE